jgi:hypothetical protein
LNKATSILDDRATKGILVACGGATTAEHVAAMKRRARFQTCA